MECIWQIVVKLRLSEDDTETDVSGTQGHPIPVSSSQKKKKKKPQHDEFYILRHCVLCL